MREALKSYLTLAAGVTEVTRQRAIAAAKALVAQGEATAEQVSSLAEDLLTQTRQNRDAVASLVGFEVERALARVGLASADELTALTERVRALEAALASSARGAGSAPAAKAPAKTAAKAPAKTAAKAPAKTTARKAPAKKAAPTTVPATADAPPQVGP